MAERKPSPSQLIARELVRLRADLQAADARTREVAARLAVVERGAGPRLDLKALDDARLQALAEGLEAERMLRERRRRLQCLTEQEQRLLAPHVRAELNGSGP